VRWATVLTDAPLEVTGGPTEQRCGTCRECVEICPAQAYTGEPYRLGEPREVRFAAHKCSKYFDKMQEVKGVSVCGLCLYVCPHGRGKNG
jgi:epoxyqueuosine reductase QueG